MVTLSNLTLSDGSTARIYKDAFSSTLIQFTVKRGKEVKHSGRWITTNRTFICTEGLSVEDQQTIKDAIEQAHASEKQREADNLYWRTGGHNGPTGHGDICMSDADPGL